MVEPRQVHWISNKTCAQVLERYNGVWIEISWRRWSGVAGIYRLRLGRSAVDRKSTSGVASAWDQQ
jgi:hypothetical protein